MTDDQDPVKKAFSGATDVDPLSGDQRATPGGDYDGDSPPPSDAMDDKRIAECAEFDLNDLGNGQRLRTYFGDDLRHVPDVGWFRFMDGRWRADPKGLLTRQLGHRVSPLILREAAYLTLSPAQMNIIQAARDQLQELKDLESVSDLDEAQTARVTELKRITIAAKSLNKTLQGMRQAHRKYARSSGNSAKLRNMADEAAPYLSITVQDFDDDPMMLNCENVTLKFKVVAYGDDDDRLQADFESLNHDRSHMITKQIDAAYDPDAKCPAFDRFLKRVQPNRAIREFLQRWHGYGLLGHAEEQRVAFYYGEGANGKSTLTNLIERLMADYSASIPIEAIVGADERRSDAATPDLVKLPGTRYVNASEPKTGADLKEDMVKKMTGGDLMRARFLHGEFFEFFPQFTLTLVGNHKPDIKGGGHAIWRRLLLVPWNDIIPDNEIDKTLPSKLWEERSGILNWLINGAIDYLEGGLRVPSEVEAATSDYRAESDPIETFLSTCCVVTGLAEDKIKATRMNAAFNFWLKEDGMTEWQPRSIASRFKAKSKARYGDDGRRFEHKRDSATTHYFGITFTPAFLRQFEDP